MGGYELMRQINDTTFISDNLGDLKPVVTIGGKPVDKFIPNLNMSFHDDKFFINLNRRDKQAINTTDKAEIDGIDKDIFYIDADGRFKWDIEFKERPSKNSWTWELKHTDGIEFYYQGELTAEEIADGCERPAEVVGSYAVYCNKANNKYKTGKLCHIYRPFCYDINAESIYADLKIADGQLTITIDETWLNNAVYPVRLDPTIGFTSAPGSTTSSTNRFFLNLAGLSIQASSSGTCSKVYFYKGSGTSGGVEVGVYNSASPKNLIKKTTQTNNFTENAYNELSTDSFNIVSGNYYFLAVGCIGTLSTGHDTTSGNSCYIDTTTAGVLPSTISGTQNRTYIIPAYLEYTESGSYDGILKRFNGSSWVKSKLKRFDGADFVDANLKFYDGTWKTVDTTGV